ncbi:myogenesis-regulating glycosidase-like [Babylonia areolata]|uniref:myogenesis-regulating glycosidase-like n=1 Tax=Babylonia areolata TaxID=304850 RepID=UPI003FD05304
MDRHQTVTIEKQKLQRLALLAALLSAFLYLSYVMLFGPCTMSLPGFKVTGDLDFRFTSSSNEPLLSGHFDFGHPRPDSMSFDKHIIDRMDYCISEKEYNTGCIEELHHQRIRVSYEETSLAKCYHIVREGLQCPSQEVKDCFDMSDAHWYGGFTSLNQPWPLEKAELPSSVYVSSDSGFHTHGVGGVLERLFFSSKGVGIFVSPDVPLFVSLNPLGDRRLCLSARYDGGYYTSPNHQPPTLNYTICHAPDARTIFTYMSEQFLPRPQDTPDPRLFTLPIWSTWAAFKKNITQQKVLDFAANITKYELPAAQVEIDDDWTPHYGDLDFDAKKFPDPAGMVKQLKDMGHRVTLWTHPFMSLDSQAFQDAAENHYVVTTRGSQTPALVPWWNGKMAALVDVTNPAAVQWYLDRLQALRDTYGVSSFKFDAGEAMYVPQHAGTFTPMDNPGAYSKGWAELAYNADLDPRHQEVRCAWNTQSLPVFLRLFDRMSTWEAESGGLETLIPSVLTLGLLGYPFVLPDMIGGNAYVDMSFMDGEYPDKELYVRWLEASALLPAMQFSIPPWAYDDEVVAITRRYVELHEKYAPTILTLAREAVVTGKPIIRPLWWVAPTDEEALTMASQFLLGDDLIVAPVLIRGARKRDIYIPEGVWKDVLRDQSVTGPVWLRGYDVQLNELPLFERI